MAFSGLLTVQVMHSVSAAIATGTYSLTKVPTLTPGVLLSASVTRSQPIQGKVSVFSLSWTTPGILLANSVVELDLPLN